MKLDVLLVEDEPDDMRSYLRDLPAAFHAAGIIPTFHPAESFQKGFDLVDSSERRFDLILSDTFRGQQKNRDAAVIEMVSKFKAGRFCPLIVFSASARPSELEIGAFVLWADKTIPGDIERAIQRMLATGIPQLARSLHNELDRTAGGFLWEFLETHWERLCENGVSEAGVLERLVRRRAALQLVHMVDVNGTVTPVSSIAGLEYYLYPPLQKDGFGLGHVVRRKGEVSDLRVVLTPHCHLAVQPQQVQPRAEYVLTVKTIPAQTVLGREKILNARNLDEAGRNKKLKSWSTPPSGSDVGKPSGRYWYLPGFLEIPHSFCDFQQLESLSYGSLASEFEGIAVLTPPYAESLQSCFIAYHAGVGIPNITPSSIKTLLD